MFNNAFSAIGKAFGQGKPMGNQGSFFGKLGGMAGGNFGQGQSLKPAMGMGTPDQGMMKQPPQEGEYMKPTGEGIPTDVAPAQMMPFDPNGAMGQQSSGLFQQLMQRLGKGNSGFTGGLGRF